MLGILLIAELCKACSYWIEVSLASPILHYIILLNIHKGIDYNFHVAWLLYFDLDCWLLLPWRGTQPTILQLFPRYSVDIYKCTNASELISLSRRVHVGCKNLWTTPVVLQARLSLPVWESGPRDYTSVHVHIAIATQVIQLLHSLPANCRGLVGDRWKCISQQ